MQKVHEISDGIRSGKISPVKLVEESLRKAEEEKELNCFITVLKQEALRDAELLEREAREGRLRSNLHGVPGAIKDIIYIKGVRCTAGSKILSENIPEFDSVVTRKIREAGSVIIGTTNLHEFASGVTSVNPHYGAVRNPVDKERIAGGSSGGSAAAVSAGIVPYSIGTDTSGSIRIPSSLCGVYGLKPTYGLVSRNGVIPLAPSLDTVGPIAGTALDLAMILEVIAGHEENDYTTAEVSVGNLVEETKKERKYRVCVPENYIEPAEQEVISGFYSFLDRLKNLGFEVGYFDFKNKQEITNCWLIIRRAEASAFHQRFMKDYSSLYGKDVREKLELGMQIRAVDYINSQDARQRLREEFLSLIEGYDIVATPTTAIRAPRIGEERVEISGKEYDIYDLLTRYTMPFNLLGFPALSAPFCKSRGLPFGVQLVSRPFEEAKILNAAYIYEKSYGTSGGE